MEKTNKIMSTTKTGKREKQFEKRRNKIEEIEIFYIEYETGQRIL